MEENGRRGGNSSVAELEVRVEELEGTVVDQETRLTAAENGLEGIMVFIRYLGVVCPKQSNCPTNVQARKLMWSGNTL